MPYKKLAENIFFTDALDNVPFLYIYGNTQTFYCYEFELFKLNIFYKIKLIVKLTYLI